MKNVPRVFAILIIVHVLAFFLLMYRARLLLKKLVDMIPGVSEKQNVTEIAGRWLVVNPIAILFSFLLSPYLWGVADTLLAVPLLATFKIFCDRIEPLKRVARFSGNHKYDIANTHAY